MNKPIKKVHTDEYLHLKRVAERLDKIWNAAQGHTARTINSVRRELRAQWDAEVTSLIGGGSPPGTINAARRRLEERKNMLSFLDEEH